MRKKWWARRWASRKVERHHGWLAGHGRLRDGGRWSWWSWAVRTQLGRAAECLNANTKAFEIRQPVTWSIANLFFMFPNRTPSCSRVSLCPFKCMNVLGSLAAREATHNPTLVWNMEIEVYWVRSLGKPLYDWSQRTLLAHAFCSLPLSPFCLECELEARGRAGILWLWSKVPCLGGQKTNEKEPESMMTSGISSLTPGMPTSWLLIMFYISAALFLLHEAAYARPVLECLSLFYRMCGNTEG